MTKDLLGIVDASILCDGLEPLTTPRLPSAIPFSAKYRLIDFTLSNLKHSGVQNVAIFPNSNYRSLYDHVGSGKAWELDRKRDGLFILPPHEVHESSKEMLSFSRIKEHIEYLARSRQKYVVITCGILVWNIDFNDVLNNHIESNADITEVLHHNQRLGTFILEKELLIDLVLRHDFLGYRHMYDVSGFAQHLNMNYYYHQGYTKKIDTIYEYYRTNMDMLDFDIGKTIFTPERPILTKTKDSAPTLYGKYSDLSNSIIANGATILGAVSGSVISRNVVINEGAIVRDSIIMQGSTIKKHAVLEHCILDKRVTIGENVVLKGTKEKPIVIKKETRQSNNEKYKVLHVASECYPFIKTGGLADVIGSLPKEQRTLGIYSEVCIPLYKVIQESYNGRLRKEMAFKLHYKNQEIPVVLFSLQHEGLVIKLIKVGDYFNRSRAYDYGDDFDRFYLFNKAVLELLNLRILTPDVVHVHDWHAGLLPLLVKEYGLDHIKSVLTIHNLAYQGVFHNEETILYDPILKNNDINFLESAIKHADLLTTVSETYSEEIQYSYFGAGLHDLIRSRNDDLTGIVNGIDGNVFNPKTDSFLNKNYNVDTYLDKLDNKAHLQTICNLKVDKRIPIISMVTRLVEQKGLDLVLTIFDELMAETNIQFVVLGSGEAHYEEMLKNLEKKYPDRVRIYIGYDSFNANRLYAGSDLFLMPSRFEPCGLSQLIALRYGTIPIVRETGGLKDTVTSYNEFMRVGNGFSFTNYNAHDMKYTIKRALSFYENRDHWDQLVMRAMTCDFSWHQSAIKYDQLYKRLLKF